MRKEKIITLKDGETQLTFKIRAMSAIGQRDWLLLLLKTAGAAGIKFPNGSDLRAAALYCMKNVEELCRNIDLDGVKELLDGLLCTCSRVVGKIEEPCTPETIDDYVEDVSTLMQIYSKAAEVSFGFFAQENRSESPRTPSIQLHKPQGS